MPRKSRFFIPGIPVHAFQRGHNKSPVFFDDEDYLTYLRFLKAAVDDLDCRLHAYVLMTNHVHLLVTPKTSDGISLLFQSVGRQYVPYINKTYGRRGSLWEGRYKACLIDEDNYLLACMRYIELNPVRAGMVMHPAQYRWSSYACNALGVDNALITPHAQYLALGLTSVSRKEAYKERFNASVDDNELALFRQALQSGTPLGHDRFKVEIESVLGRKIGQAKVGRPRKLDRIAGQIAKWIDS